MDHERDARYEAGLREYLKGEVSRAQMLRASVLGLAVAAAPGAAEAATGGTAAPGSSFPYFPQISGRYTTETVREILNTLLTFEHLVVTLFAGSVSNAKTLGLTSLQTTILQAVLAQEQYHADFLSSLGATSQTDTFHVPNPALLTNATAFFRAMDLGETVGTGTYMAAAREFAELGQPTLVKYAYQIGATEAEHRVLARHILALGGDTTGVPPNNKAFESDLFIYVRDATAVLQQTGFLGGSGTTVTYPGRDAALALAGSMAGALVNKTPNNATSSASAADIISGAR